MKTQKDADAVILTIIPEEYEEILAAIGNTARAELGGTNNL
ncbi:hypothetical protein EV699_12165 [Plasticicumulans lactativorans]|uniref:Uncharacterized protein n=1 Tax=Plasticicumulans lactativorans TaxID=1133106 RepID=A0A4R2L0B9_9GAMM|nr:hypothetical protein EV699_12165 [Plasticicumulans lactativorans]